MMLASLAAKAEEYLTRLCLEIPTRRVGSQGNQAATEFFAKILDSFGFETQTPEFDCMDWISEGVRLTGGAISFKALASPYSPGCRVSAPLAVLSTVDELASIEAPEAMFLLKGELADEPLMPKNFPFYNPDEHKRIIYLLETKRPGAILSATSRNPQMAGGLYPFPLIEDGDFDIPSAYLTEEEGERLAVHAGKQLSLEIQAKRIPSKARNVIGRKIGGTRRRVVVCAHIDSKVGTPGALDNASGVTVLLLLAELLTNYQGELGIELVAINGEDYYSNPGEIQYLESNRGKFEEILLDVNIDGAGYVQGESAYSLYECPEELAGLIRKTFSAHPHMVEGEQWYQGDHMIFAMNRVPSVALTSERAMELMAHIVHTPKDEPANIDSGRLVDLARAIRDLLIALGEQQHSERETNYALQRGERHV